MPLVRLKIRPQFLKIAAKGRKAVRPTLLMQGLKLNDHEQTRAKALARKSHVTEAVFVGFTASKKVGNAVARNRAKRRLTHLANDLLPASGRSGWGYVVIARAAAVAAPHANLKQDMMKAINSLHRENRSPHENNPHQEKANNNLPRKNKPHQDRPNARA